MISKYIKLVCLPAIALTIITLSAFFVLSSKPSSAVTATTNASVTVTEACTMTTGSSDTPHTATINPGTNRRDPGIGLTTLTVTCNDNSGYAIYAVGFTGDVIGGTNSTKLIGTNTGQTIVTGTATSGDTSNWVMKLTAGTNAPTIQNGYGSFKAVPSSYTLVASKTSSTGSTASTVTTTYGAYISSTQVADTYVGKVKYTMVHPSSATP